MALAYDLHRQRSQDHYAADIPDHCSRDGAFALKLRIEAYWRERGYEVTVNLDEKGFVSRMRSTRYDLRSDMVGGWPKKAEAK